MTRIARFVALKPLRALVGRAADWPYSSVRALFAGSAGPQ